MRKRRWYATATAVFVVGVISATLTSGAIGRTAAPSRHTKTNANVKVALVLHVRIPFTQEIADGAAEAAREFGAKLDVTGPSGFDPPTAISDFNSEIQAGAKGVAVVAFPPDLWRRPVQNAINSGTPVATLNAGTIDLGANSPPYVGVDEVANGRALGTVVGKALGRKAKGEVVVGICTPGLYVLTDRVKGIKEGLARTAPGVVVRGPYNVTGDPSTNYTTWKGLILAHPSALAFVGVCAFDLPNLVKIKEKSPGAKYQIAGVDLEPDALRGIKEGIALATDGQSPYMQGYVPVRLLLAHILKGKPMPHGWINSGLELVTKANVTKYIARENSIKKTVAWYRPEVQKIFANPLKASKSFKAQRK